MTLLLLASLVACSLLEEQRDPVTDVRWSGYVYADIPSDTAPLLEAGTFQVVDLDDVVVADGVQTSTAGYWDVTVPVGLDVAVRVDGGAQAATVWRGQTPTGRAYWLSGALFAFADDTVDDFFDSLDGWQGLSPQRLSDGDIAHLWGSPLVPDDWAGADVTVLDADGNDVAVVLLAYDQDGALIDAGTGPVDFFVAPDLPPGTVTLQVQAADGRALQEQWPARGGDLVSAFYVDLGLADGG